MKGYWWACLVAVVACNPAARIEATTSLAEGANVQPIVSQPFGSASACWQATPGPGGQDRFVDATESKGLIDPLLGMRAHAAAFGDVDRDGQLDLVVGTFGGASDSVFAVRGATGPSPDRLLFGGDLGFSLADGFLTEPARTSGVAFADLDNDSDLDLVLSRYPRDRAPGGSLLMENRGDGLVEVTESGLPQDIAGRSVGVLDFDRDGLLDLLVLSDPRGEGSSRLLHNLGGLRFEDVTASAFVEGVFGLGVGVADLTGDLIPDVFVGGSNRLFVGSGRALAEVDSQVFSWETYGPEDDVAGVAIADLNRDGWPDLVVGHHFNSTLDQGREVPIRLYLHAGLDSTGRPRFDDVTALAGLPGIPTKAPHVEIADMDNDGWPDIVTSASAGDGPAVFFHQGLQGGVPTFATPSGLGSPQYWVTAPTSDVDRDGRLDLFLAEWEPALPSRLFLNKGDSGSWLAVELALPGLGIGAKVSVFGPGSGGSGEALVGVREIGATVGYTAGTPPIAHFGLGDLDQVDLRVELPTGEVWSFADVAANQHLRLPDAC